MNKFRPVYILHFVGAVAGMGCWLSTPPNAFVNGFGALLFALCIFAAAVTAVEGQGR